MADILQSMGIAGVILLGVVGLVILMSYAAVKRGEMAMHGEHDVKAWWNAGPSKSSGAVATAPMTSADISVMQILLVGTAMFVVAVLFLFIVSVLGHL